mgnify:CR=1 FL=1
MNISRIVVQFLNDREAQSNEGIKNNSNDKNSLVV